MPAVEKSSGSSYAASTTSLEPNARIIRRYGTSAGSVRSNIVSIERTNSSRRDSATDRIVTTTARQASGVR